MTQATESLLNAIKAGDAAELRKLLTAHPGLVQERPTEGPTPMLLAVYHGHRELATVLLESGYALNVFEAAALGRLNRVRELINQSSQLVNSWSSDGVSPLGLAAFFGQIDVATLLLERGADANAESRNMMRVAPLHSAVAGRQTKIAELLLAHGARVNARQQGGITPLHQAAQHGQLEMIRLLLSYGADPKATKNDGLSPRDLANAHGHREAAALL